MSIISAAAAAAAADAPAAAVMLVPFVFGRSVEEVAPMVLIATGPLAFLLVGDGPLCWLRGPVGGRGGECDDRRDASLLRAGGLLERGRLVLRWRAREGGGCVYVSDQGRCEEEGSGSESANANANASVACRLFLDISLLCKPDFGILNGVEFFFFLV